ncbi:MAG TPA: hypothetical protein VGC79_14050 [Polyangiaceae bacterium]
MSVLFYALVAAVLVGVAAWLVLEVRRTRAEVRRLHKVVKTYRRIDAVEREAVRLMREIARRG